MCHDGNCSGVTTYTQGLLIGCMTQAYHIKTAFGFDLDSSVDYLAVACNAFRIAKTHLSREGVAYDGDEQKLQGCDDNNWFRAILFWNLIKLYADADDNLKGEIGGYVSTNWNTMRDRLIDGRWTADDWTVTSPMSVGCVKTQMSLFWLAIAKPSIQAFRRAHATFLRSPVPR